MFKCAFLAVTVISVAAPVSAQTTVQPQPIQAATDHSDVNKLICKREEQIGSRLGAKKVCMTLEQWQARQAADREQTERVQQGAKGPSSGG